MNTPVRRATVVASCHAPGIATSLRRLYPDAEIKAFHVRAMKDTAAAERACEDVDLVVTQLGDDAAEPNPFAPSRLRGKAGRVVSFPVITFTGFHPDIFLTPKPHPGTKYDLGQYVSAIAVAAFGLGFDSRRAERLYNAHTYEILGFEAYFEQVKYEFFAIAREAGFDVVPYFQAWIRRGAFMHSINHPTIRVIDTFTRLALGHEPEVGTVVGDGFSPADDRLLMSAVLPVYPEYARRIGVPGGTTFRRPIVAADRSSATNRDLSLRDVVEQTYRVMELQPRKFAGSERVERTAEAISAYLPRARTVSYRRTGTQWRISQLHTRAALSGAS